MLPFQFYLRIRNRALRIHRHNAAGKFLYHVCDQGRFWRIRSFAITWEVYHPDPPPDDGITIPPIPRNAITVV